MTRLRKLSITRTLPQIKSVRWLSSTVNSAEVDKFGKIGEDWWDDKATSGTGPLHAMNPIRIGYIRSILAKEFNTSHLPVLEQIKNKRILDIGCGGGLASEALARLGAKVTGIDPSPENIHIATQHSIKDNLTSHIDYRVSTIENIADEITTANNNNNNNNSSDSSDNRFDCVCALEVIEHVEEIEIFLQSASSVLKPGGSFFLSTINRTPLSYAVAIVGAERVLRLLPNGTHDWSKFPQPEEMRSTLAHCGLYIEEIKGMTYNPKGLITGEESWKLSDDLEINYILHAIKAP